MAYNIDPGTYPTGGCSPIPQASADSGRDAAPLAAGHAYWTIQRGQDEPPATDNELRQALQRFIPDELLFPKVEGHYKTIWQFLYEREPWVLDDMERLNDGGVITNLVEEERQARSIAIRELEPVITLEAPEALKKIGHPYIGCYTKAVLLEVFA